MGKRITYQVWGPKGERLAAEQRKNIITRSEQESRKGAGSTTWSNHGESSGAAAKSRGPNQVKKGKAREEYNWMRGVEAKNKLRVEIVTFHPSREERGWDPERLARTLPSRPESFPGYYPSGHSIGFVEPAADHKSRGKNRLHLSRLWDAYSCGRGYSRI